MRYTVPVKPLKMFRISLQAFSTSVPLKRWLRYTHSGPFTSQALATLLPRVVASVKDSKLSCGPKKKENRQHESIRVLSCVYPYYIYINKNFLEIIFSLLNPAYSNSGCFSKVVMNQSAHRRMSSCYKPS